MQRWLVYLSCLGTLLLVGACTPDTPLPPLRLSSVIWIGYAPFYIVRDLAFYPPVKLDIITMHASIDTEVAFLQKRTDLLTSSLFDALRLRDQGGDFKIVLVLDHSAGADGIAARPGIRSVGDLRGQRIAIEVGIVTQYTLLRALDQAGLTETDITMMNFPHDYSLTALQQQQVDAAVLWEPLLTRARAAGMGTIFSSREIPGEILDVLLVQRSVVEQRSNELVAYLRAWDRAVQALRAQQQEATQAAIKYLGIPAPELASNMAGVALLDLEENRRLFALTKHTSSLARAYALTAEFMVRHHLLQSPPGELEPILDTHLVSRAHPK